MHPPYSMIFFTTLIGAAQGLVLALVAVQLAADWRLVQVDPVLFIVGAVSSLVLSTIALFAASFHLGRPSNAWRSASQWRTSWLSREVIALPLFVLLVSLWGLSALRGSPDLLLGVLAAVVALALYVCTGMIYGAVKAIREWATPMTPLNYTVIGLASGTLLSTALAAAVAPQLTATLGELTLILMLIAAMSRSSTFWRNQRLAHTTTVQTAIGIRHPRINQISQGSMGGTFNTREFLHGHSKSALLFVRWLALMLGFILPAGMLMLGADQWSTLTLVLLFLLQWVGLLAERWSFFTEARHPQNLYCQSTS